MTWDYQELSDHFPKLREYLGKDGKIDFKNADAVRAFNQAILKKEFNLSIELPQGHLCPTIPNRQAYLVILKQLMSILSLQSSKSIGIDIGTGVSAIYPILGSRILPDARFIATDIDQRILDFATKNISLNGLSDRIELILNPNPSIIFPSSISSSLLSSNSFIFALSNPPFYSNQSELNNCKRLKIFKPHASANQLSASEGFYEPGGEVAFVKQMIKESLDLAYFDLFSCLLGKKDSLIQIIHHFKSLKTPTLSFAFTTIRPGFTTRWIIFWSFRHKIPLSQSHLLKLPPHLSRTQSIKTSIPLNSLYELVSSYGQARLVPPSKLTLALSHNTWSRKYRRSSDPPANLDSIVNIEIELKNDFLTLNLGEDETKTKDENESWDNFISFTNHLRGRIKQ